MTRRELINALLDGDMNDEIYIALADGEEWEEAFPIDYVDADVIAPKGYFKEVE